MEGGDLMGWIDQDTREILTLAAGNVGCGCLLPALILLGFLWAVARIFGWGS